MKRLWYILLVICLSAPLFGQARASRYVMGLSQKNKLWADQSFNRTSSYSGNDLGGAWWNTDYPTTMGTRFYVSFMRNRGVSVQDQANATMFLYATAWKTTTVTVENPNTGWSKVFNVAAGSQSNAIVVPIAQCYPGDTTGIYDTGLRVTASPNPISLYATNHNSGSYDGTNVYPVSALEREYVIQTYISDYDVTQFALVPTQACTGIQLNVKKTYINSVLLHDSARVVEDSVTYETITLPFMQAGQVYFYRAGSDIVSLSGTTVCSPVPLAVFNGGQDAEVPSFSGGATNHLFAQACATDQLGQKFIVTSTHGQKYDYVRFTAVENGTVLKRNGMVLATLNALETYQDTMSAPVYGPLDVGTQAWYYESTSPIVAYMYATDYSLNGDSISYGSSKVFVPAEYGSPVLTPLSPWEQRMDSCIFAVFPQQRDDGAVGLTNNIQVHYVNIVVTTASVYSTRLNGQNIGSHFSVVPSNPTFSYAEVPVTISMVDSSNYTGYRLYNPNGFIARVYGFGKSGERREAYAYSAGCRVARSADFLIDDQYIKQKTICVNDPGIKFTSIINYDYENVHWEFRGRYRDGYWSSTGLTGFTTVLSHTAKGDSIIKKTWDATGIDTVLMIVQRSTPLCDNIIYDTVKGLIQVQDTFLRYLPNQNICYGDSFIFYSTSGEAHRFIADTVTVQSESPFIGQRLKLNTSYGYTRSLKTVQGQCDSIVHQSIIIRPKYERTIFDTICASQLPYTYNKELKNLMVEGPYPNSKDTTINPKTKIFGCDSIVHYNLVVYPGYQKDTFVQICTNQEFLWHGIHYVGEEFSNIQSGDVVVGEGARKDTLHYSTQQGYACDSMFTLYMNVVKRFTPEMTFRTCQNHFPDEIRNVFNVDSFPQMQTDFTLPGSYTYIDSLKSQAECDSIITLHIIVDSAYYIYDTLETCQSHIPYRWEDNRNLPSQLVKEIDVSTVGVIRDTMAFGTIHDCDSIYYLFLTVHPTRTDTVRRTICDNESFTWQNRKYAGLNSTDTVGTNGVRYASGDYVDSIPGTSFYGCDSTAFLVFHVDSTTEKHLSFHACTSVGGFATFEGFKCPLDRVNTYDTVKFEHTKGGYGCDSIVYIHVKVDSAYHYIMYDTVCKGTPYLWTEHEHVNVSTNVVDNDAVFMDIDTTIFGCDSIYELHLTILPAFRDSVQRDISEEDTCQWLGVVYGGEKTLYPHDITLTKDTIIYHNYQTVSVGQFTCDSTLILHLRIGKVYRDTIYDTICANESFYNWMRGDSLVRQIAPIPEVGTHRMYYDSLTTVLGFDSVFMLDLFTAPTYFFADTQHVCQNTPFVWVKHENSILIFDSNNRNVSSFPTDSAGTFLYYDKLQTKGMGCDSVWQLRLVVDPVYYMVKDTALCQDNTNFVWTGHEGHILTGPNGKSSSIPLNVVGKFTYIDSLQTRDGCDSIWVLKVTVNPTYLSPIRVDTAHICDNGMYSFHNHVYCGDKLTLDGATILPARDDYYELDTTLTSVYGCDSVVKHLLFIHPTYASTREYHVCQKPDSMWTWRDDESGYVHKVVSISIPGSYPLTDTLPTQFSCDSVFGLVLIVDPIYTINDTVNLCENDSVSWQRVLFVGAQYAAFGKSYNSADYDSIRTGLVPGTYRSQIRYGTTGYDCDSIYNLTLYVHPVDFVTIVDSACRTDAYYYPNLNNGVGGYLPTDRDTTIVRNDTIQSTLHCDSIVQLTFHVYPIYEFIQADYHICQDPDSMWIWYDEQGGAHDTISLAQAGSFFLVDSLTTIHECDSLFGIRVIIDPIYEYFDTLNICEYDSVLWQGKTFSGDKFSGVVDTVCQRGMHRFSAHYFTISGCDSIFHLALYVHAVYDTVDMVHICENEVPYVWYTTDHNGTYTDTIVISDSLVGSVLNETDRDTLYRTRTRMLESVYGCDSLVTLQLTIHPTYFFRTDTTICSDEKLLWRGRYFGAHDTICTDHLFTETWHCDSIYQLRLFVKPAYLFHQTLELCDNETAIHTNGWSVIWSPGMPISDSIHLKYNTIEGCDSIYCYFLNIHPTFYHEDSATICSNEKYPFHGDSWIDIDSVTDVSLFALPFDTVVIDSLNTIHGCDSVYKLFAHVLPSYLHVDYDTICANEGITWRNKSYGSLSAGDHIFYDSLTNIYGCDSIYKLLLCVHPVYFYDLHETICDEDVYVFNGLSISDSAGIYFFTDSFASVWGCDSVYHLHLTINPSTYVEEYDTFCVNEKYYWPEGILRTKPGDYQEVLTNNFGCNQYTTLHLTQIEPTIIHVKTDTICADDRDFVIHYTYEGMPPIAYTIRFDSMGHAQGFKDVVWQPIDSIDSVLFVDVPYGDALPHPNPTYYITRDDKPGFVRGYNNQDMYAYVRPDKYPVTVFLHNGYCADSLSMDSTQILNVWYPDWIHEQHWNDAIVLYNDLYNGGYTWNSYQWYEDGKPLLGQERDYYYNPQHLHWGHAYNVRLTREDDGYTTFTCPIYPDSIIDYLTPKMDYVSVVPTLIYESYPVVNILSTEGGWYNLASAGTGLIHPGNVGRFEKNALNATEVRLILGDAPVYIMTMKTDSGYIRRQKIIVLKK